MSQMSGISRAAMTYWLIVALSAFLWSSSDGARQNDEAPSGRLVLPFCCPPEHVFNVSHEFGCQHVGTTPQLTFYNADDTPVKEDVEYEVQEGFQHCPSFSSILRTHGFEKLLVLRTGNLKLSSSTGMEPLVFPPNKYCLIFFEDEMAAVACFEDENFSEMNHSPYYDAIYTRVYPALLSISVAFLVVTLVVYSLLRSLRNELGLCVMNELVALSAGKVILIVMKTHTAHGALMCHLLGFLLQYFFFVAFLWLNVISLHVFRSIVFQKGNSGKSKLVYLLLCGSYTWGVAFLLTLTTIILNILGPPQGSFLPHPGIGLRFCWFASNSSKKWYFFGPVAIILAVNVSLFIASAVKLAIMRKQNKTSTSLQFFLYLKLLLLMGVTWVIEVIPIFIGESVAAGQVHYHWVVLDVINLLQGLWIFLVLVCRRSILSQLVTLACGTQKSLKWFPERNAEHDEADVDVENLEMQHAEDKK